MSGPFGSNQFFGVSATAEYVPKGAIWLDGGSDYLVRDPSSSGNRRTFTFSCWLKRTDLGGNGVTTGNNIFGGDRTGSYSDRLMFGTADDGNDYLEASFNDGSSGTCKTSAVYRDPTAWMHVLWVVDTTQGTASNRVKIYVNGVEAPLNSPTYPAQDYDTYINYTENQAIGVRPGTLTQQHYGGYLSQVILLDGTAVSTPTDFGQFDSNGVWIPIEPTGLTFGTNGFWLDFADSSDLGNDVSGNGNDYTLNNIDSSNATADRPADSSTTGNFCTWNVVNSSSDNTYSEGALKVVGGGSSGRLANGTIATTSGKWYYEFKWTGTIAGGLYLGLSSGGDINFSTNGYPGNSDKGWACYFDNTTTFRIYHNGSNTNITLPFTAATNDLLLVAWDVDAGDIWFGAYDVSGTSEQWVDNSGSFGSFNASSPTYSSVTFSDYLIPQIGLASSSYSGVANFGGTAFTVTPPTGHNKLNTANLAAPTITKPSDHFLPMIYEGNGTGQRVGQFIPFTDDYDISHAALFSGSNYLSQTFSTNPTGGGASGNQKFTLSFWLKMNLNKNVVASIGAGNGSALYGSAADSGSGAVLWQWGWSATQGAAFNFTDWSNVSGGGSNWLRRVLGNATSTAGPQGGREQLDYTAWHHYVVACDWSSGGGLAGTDACVKVYIDGVLQTRFLYDGSALIKTNPATTNYSNIMSNGVANYIGTYQAGSVPMYKSYYYMAEAIGVDGQQLDASVFGQTDTSSNRWVPKDPTTTLSSASDFGNNGFYLKFEDGTNLGNDSSGNNNDWSMTNFDTTNGSDQMYDTPSRNTATISKGAAASTAELSGGNLTIGGSSGDPLSSPFTIQEVSSGKWYFEGRIDAIDTSTGGPSMGFALSSALSNSTNTAASPADYYTMRIRGGPSIQCNNDGTSWQPSNAPTVAVGTVYGLFIDCDNGKAWGAVDGTIMQNSAGDSVGSPSAGTNPTFVFTANTSITFFAGGSNAGDITINPGSWRYFDGAATTLDSDAGGYFQSTSIPTGFKALNQDHLPTNTAGITGFSWIKNRDASDNHILSNRVSGISKYLVSNSDGAEVIDANGLKRFLQEGVQIGKMDAVNTANESLVLWQWVANGTGTTNTEGTGITSTVSANTTAGFSALTYVGTGNAGDTVGHGLGAVPSFIIVKNSSDTGPGWYVYHKSIGVTKYIRLEGNASAQTSSDSWNDGSPAFSTTTFTVGGGGSYINDSGKTHVAYCWTEIEGYSKFGSYTGNGDPDGPYISLGFKPRYFMVKCSSTTGSWLIYDTVRQPYNPNFRYLQAQATTVERTTSDEDIDIIAGGVKCRSLNSSSNSSGQTYVYAAFADNPFGGSGVAQAKAR